MKFSSLILTGAFTLWWPVANLSHYVSIRHTEQAKILVRLLSYFQPAKKWSNPSGLDHFKTQIDLLKPERAIYRSAFHLDDTWHLPKLE